jgi:hypothetical protein
VARFGPHHHRKFFEIVDESNRIPGEDGVFLRAIA